MTDHASLTPMTTDPDGKPVIDWALLLKRCDPEDLSLVGSIVQRAVNMIRERMRLADRGDKHYDATIERGAMSTAQSVMCMKILHVHSGVCPLHLWRWLASDMEDFRADFSGIDAYLDTDTGMFRDGFWPRFARNDRPTSTH